MFLTISTNTEHSQQTTSETHHSGSNLHSFGSGAQEGAVSHTPPPRLETNVLGRAVAQQREQCHSRHHERRSGRAGHEEGLAGSSFRGMTWQQSFVWGRRKTKWIEHVLPTPKMKKCNRRSNSTV